MKNNPNEEELFNIEALKALSREEQRMKNDATLIPPNMSQWGTEMYHRNTKTVFEDDYYSLKHLVETSGSTEYFPSCREYVLLESKKKNEAVIGAKKFRSRDGETRFLTNRTSYIEIIFRADHKSFFAACFLFVESELKKENGTHKIKMETTIDHKANIACIKFYDVKVLEHIYRFIEIYELDLAAGLNRFKNFCGLGREVLDLTVYDPEITFDRLGIGKK